MEFQNLIETYLPLIKRHFWPLFLGLLGLMFLIYGLISLLTASKPENNTSFDSNKPSVEAASAVSQNIAVDIEGSVVKTGVYKFSQNSTIQDVLIVLVVSLPTPTEAAWRKILILDKS